MVLWYVKCSIHVFIDMILPVWTSPCLPSASSHFIHQAFPRSFRFSLFLWQLPSPVSGLFTIFCNMSPLLVHSLSPATLKTHQGQDWDLLVFVFHTILCLKLVANNLLLFSWSVGINLSVYLHNHSCVRFQEGTSYLF